MVHWIVVGWMVEQYFSGLGMNIFVVKIFSSSSSGNLTVVCLKLLKDLSSLTVTLILQHLFERLYSSWFREEYS